MLDVSFNMASNRLHTSDVYVMSILSGIDKEFG